MTGQDSSVRTGEFWPLEEAALELLMDQRRQGSTKISDKNDWLTPEQLQLRQDREVYNINGYPESRIHQGVFSRAYNPLMGRRPRGRFDPYGEMAFDGRVPHSHDTVSTAWTGDQWYGRSSWWADSGLHGLDRYQRCRIRRELRRAHPARLRSIRARLAEKYGVPEYVIARVAIRSRNCNT